MGKRLLESFLQGKPLPEIRLLTRRRRHHMAYEIRYLAVFFDRHHGSSAHLRELAKILFDVAELDSEAVQLNLQVDATPVVQHARSVKVAFVSRSVGSHGFSIKSRKAE